MVGFCFVVLPLPYTVRKRVFTFFSESFIIAKLAYGLKIAFMCVILSLWILVVLTFISLVVRFVGVLFVDALNRMFRITAEVEAAKSGSAGMTHDVRAESNFAARKF